MSMIYLENDFIKAGFSTKGAELQQLLHIESGENYLWNGNAEFWGKYSPVLFPIVGGLKENTYRYNEESYKLSRHGFARDNEFSVEKQTSNELLFVFCGTSDTQAVYPFEFKLGIRYTLEKASLSCSYEVLNTGEKELLFSVGGHPAFAVHTSEELSYSDYYLQFDKDTSIEYHQIENDLISNNTKVLELDNGKLGLQHQLFYNDALVFKTLKSEKITLANNKNSNRLDFEFHNFPYFGIWAAKDADFVCLEPWCGIADVIGHDSALENKEGIVKLSQNQLFTRTWSVTIA
jgi:galactose mutarotase-like enzyme